MRRGNKMEDTSSIIISVVVPLYNKEESIDSAISSILAQDCRVSFEIVVIDDGSTDKSAEIVHQLAARHNNIKYVFQDNAGPSSARNKGIDVANGEWIVFQDADDVFLPGALQVLYDTATREKDISFACANFYIIRENGTKHVPFPKIKTAVSDRPLCLMAFERIFPRQGAFIFNKKRMPEFRFNSQYRRFEDYDILLSYFRTNPKISISSRYVMCYRQKYAIASNSLDSEQDFMCHLNFSNKSFFEKILLGHLLRHAIRLYPKLKKQYTDEFFWCILAFILSIHNRITAKIFRSFLANEPRGVSN